MLTINAICEANKSNPGKVLQVNVGGYLYGLTGVYSDAADDAVIYNTQGVKRESRPAADPTADKAADGDKMAIGADPVEEKVRAAIESVTALHVTNLVAAVLAAMKATP